MATTGLRVRLRRSDMHLSRRVFGLRCSGMVLCGLALAAVLYESNATATWWLGLGLTCLVWPLVAVAVAAYSADPESAELRNLVLDSILAGIWIALIQFNPLPSALIAVLVTTDELHLGMPRLWRWSVVMLLAAALATIFVTGFAFNPNTSLLVMFASLPALALQPLLLGLRTSRLIVRMRSQNRRLDQLMRTDAVTGLDTRRFWQQHVRLDLAAHRRTGAPISLLMVDIDNFKAINDAHGHVVGDSILSMVAGVIAQNCRASDRASRLGGDEFCIALVNTDRSGAWEVAERIRRRIAEVAQLASEPVRCTVSIGIAQADDSSDFVQWLKQADAALYRAKRLGRDCTVPDSAAATGDARRIEARAGSGATTAAVTQRS